MSTAIRKAYRGSTTGIAGVTEQVLAKTGRPQHRYYIVTPHRRRFNIDTLGRPEAFRRALRLRAEHETALTRAAAKEARRG